MNSLRYRLIIGFSLVAVMPLALGLALMGRQIQATVRSQAAERLSATLGQLEARFRSDGARLEAKLDLLARDAQLKRLYLVDASSGGELREHLANQRFLLDLDFLFVTDGHGQVVADAATVPASRGAGGGEPLPAAAIAPTDSGDARVCAVSGRQALACDASRPILYRDENVGEVRGGTVLDAAWLARLAAASGVELALFDAGARPIASTLAAAGSLRPRAGEPARRATLAGRPYLMKAVPLALGPAPYAQIVGLVSTAAADEAIASLWFSGLVLGLVALSLAIALGLLWSHQISRPVERLAAFSERISRGEWDEPLKLESVREVQTLVAALERMRGDLRDYRERLVAGERQAAYGQMARKVAHEIKNPLTPIAISVADLKRSYDLKRPDFPQILEAAVRTIGEEVHTLKRLLQEFSDFGRFPAPQFAAFDLGDLFADLGTLYGHEVEERRLVVKRPAAALVTTADRTQLRQALINLIQNGLEATAAGGRVEIGVRSRGEGIELAVSDDGPGLADEEKGQLFVPGFTTKAHGSGLGLTIVEHIVSDHRGTIVVSSAPGRGTTFLIRFPRTLPASPGPEPGA